ncbi:MAG: hypothetical protein GTO51_03440 [Candidatus Latescibacteria bacterium]|nr:hypothetical protein [Candidatus Latescibacterota bacterium]NIM20892.1 hypothetical protein [Candidatus Latescibacterota bacterium]NIM65027.1 hypothetical protein [Candidatus Latescibacterota bacterium]NIO01542.1 hypothetical protein [Candidatus Latescibacterota bacterium]NIO28059.1 hypothetical protein [Candidatus Latescibacterota bacterium]
MVRNAETKELTGKEEATVRDFLNVVFRRKLMIVSIVLVTTVLVLALNAMQPQTWESNSRILIQRGERSDLFKGGVRYLSWEEELSSQIEVILSEAVFSKARELFADSAKAGGLPEYTVFNPGAVRADVVGESNVLAIRYGGLVPFECQIGCAAVTQAYSDYYRMRKAPPELSDFFAEELQDIRSELLHWRQKKSEFLSQERFFGLDAEGKFLLDKLARLETNLSSVNSDISSQRMKVGNLKSLLKLPKDELESQLALTSPPQIQSGIIVMIKQQLQQLRIRQEELVNKYTPRHPQMIAISKQIEDLQNSLRQEVENAYRVEESYLDELVAKQQSIEGEIASARSRIDAVPDKAMQLSEIDHRIGLLESKYENLTETQGQAIVAMASNPEWEVVVLSPASAPYSKKTKDYVRIALGPFLSLVVALGLAFFFESLDHSLNNVAEVEEYLGAPVLATISEIRGGK